MNKDKETSLKILILIIIFILFEFLVIGSMLPSIFSKTAVRNVIVTDITNTEAGRIIYTNNGTFFIDHDVSNIIVGHQYNFTYLDMGKFLKLVEVQNK